MTFAELELFVVKVYINNFCNTVFRLFEIGKTRRIVFSLDFGYREFIDRAGHELCIIAND
jgi:hypothetical protein